MYRQQDISQQPAHQLVTSGIAYVPQTANIFTTLSVQQVAEKCGFSDAQNFSQAFKRWVGVSPSQFRQSNIDSD